MEILTNYVPPKTVTANEFADEATAFAAAPIGSYGEIVFDLSAAKDPAVALKTKIKKFQAAVLDAGKSARVSEIGEDGAVIFWLRPERTRGTVEESASADEATGVTK